MAITIDEVREAIHKGIRGASRKYAQWSRGWTLTDSGVEGVLVAEIAAAIHTMQAREESLLLEAPYEKCLEWSGATPQRGRRLDTFKGGRADIALFNGDGQTKYIVEVKRTLNRRTLRNDLTKLTDAIAKCSKQKDGKLMRAFLAVFLQSAGEVGLNNAKKWSNEFLERSGGQHHFEHRGPWQEQDKNAYSICIEVAP